MALLRDKNLVLEDINRGLPDQIDWKQGARDYVAYYMEELGRDFIEHYSLSKPLTKLPESNWLPHFEENLAYLANFLNVVSMLRLPPGAKVLDVACGAGWLSHFLTRLGYHTFGFDLSEDFVALARRRLATDPLIKLDALTINTMFKVHDIETAPLGAGHETKYDAIILESCLHHFFNPIAALAHLVEALAPTGILIAIEGENRTGLIRREFQAEMEKTQTLERSYPRHLLNEVFQHAGLSAYEYVGSLNGWFSQRDPKLNWLPKSVEDDCQRKNLAICARTSEALASLFPWRKGNSSVTFGSGVYDDEGSGWRWVAPYARLSANEDLATLKIAFRTEVPALARREQEVFIHNSSGLRERLVLKDNSAFLANLGPVKKDEILTLCSGDFFVPATLAGDDTRQLSFAIKLES